MTHIIPEQGAFAFKEHYGFAPMTGEAKRKAGWLE